MADYDVREILPRGYQYVTLDESFETSEKFSCILRTDINDGEIFSKWLQSFEEISNTTWILRSSVKERRFEFSRTYVCQHSDYHKKKETSVKNKNCPAMLKVRIKKDTRNTRYHDAYVKKGLRGIVILDFNHSHQVVTPEAWNWLKRSPETIDKFIGYFNRGMTPSAAKMFHENALMGNNPDLIGNSRVNPPVRWIYRLHDKWRQGYSGTDVFGADFWRYKSQEDQPSIVESTPLGFCKHEEVSREASWSSTQSPQEEAFAEAPSESLPPSPAPTGGSEQHSSVVENWLREMERLKCILANSMTNHALLKQAESFLKCCASITTGEQLLAQLEIWNSESSGAKKIKVEPT